MRDSLTLLRAEALCTHDVDVRLGQKLPAYVVTHQSAEVTRLSVPLSSVIKGADLRLAILDWLCELHDRDVLVSS